MIERFVFAVEGEVVLEHTIYGNPIPFKRVRANTRGKRPVFYNDPTYTKYKKFVGSEIVKILGLKNMPVIPEVGSKERTKHLADTRYFLRAKFYRDARRGDKDNLEKVFNDSFQDIGLIANDEQIDDSYISKAIDKDNPRVEFCLIKLPVPVKVKKPRKRKKVGELK